VLLRESGGWLVTVLAAVLVAGRMSLGSVRIGKLGEGAAEPELPRAGELLRSEPIAAGDCERDLHVRLAKPERELIVLTLSRALEGSPWVLSIAAVLSSGWGAVSRRDMLSIRSGVDFEFASHRRGWSIMDF
jgi:hypothetical protein